MFFNCYIIDQLKYFNIIYKIIILNVNKFMIHINIKINDNIIIYYLLKNNT